MFIFHATLSWFGKIVKISVLTDYYRKETLNEPSFTDQTSENRKVLKGNSQRTAQSIYQTNQSKLKQQQLNHQ